MPSAPKLGFYLAIQTVFEFVGLADILLLFPVHQKGLANTRVTAR